MTSHIIENSRHSIWIVASVVVAIAAMVIALTIYRQHQADLAINQLQIIKLNERVSNLEKKLPAKTTETPVAEAK